MGNLLRFMRMLKAVAKIYGVCKLLKQSTENLYLEWPL